MSYKESIEKYLNSLAEVINASTMDQIELFVKILVEARDKGKNIFMFGNGGAGATASHIACDFNKGCIGKNGKRFKVICLNDNIPTMLAYANDACYEDIFIEQLKNFIRPEDVVIGLSASGNSENVIRAIDYANDNGAFTVGLCGYDGGKLKKKAKLAVHIEVDDMQKAEDLQLVVCHIAMQLLEQ